MAAVYLIEATQRGRIQGVTVEVWNNETNAKKRASELEKTFNDHDLDVRKVTIRTAL